MNLKKITIIALALFYSFFLFVLSTDTLLSDILKIRQDILIHSKAEKTLMLSKQSWSNIAFKKEFKYNNNYYDVKTVTICKSFVKVIVVEDMMELIIKDITKNLKDKIKKSNALSFKKAIVQYYSKNISIGFVTPILILKNNFCYRIDIKNKFLTSLFRPPSFS